MRWKKLGNIYNPDNLQKKDSKLISHASNPTPIRINEDIYRIYYSGRDRYNRSSISAFDYNLKEMKIIKDFNHPLFTYGDKNSYFSHGVTPCCFYNINNEIYLSFMGWHIPKNKHWEGQIGRLKLKEDGKLLYEDNKPLISKSIVDPVSLSYPFILEKSDHEFLMWYGSTISWDCGNGEMLHIIKGASSKDGLNWEINNSNLPYSIGRLQAFSRPTVIKNNDKLEMWFSYRKNKKTKYRIGYAQTYNYRDWIINNELVGIDISRSGWDNEMICYPFVFNHDGSKYMLYNGNGLGKTGLGLAVLEKD